MSIDIDWDALTGGADGKALAESIRASIHDRFQLIALPRMIQSVNVHAFDFGSTPPSVEIKDVLDPLPEFYEDSDDDDSTTSEHAGTVGSASQIHTRPTGVTRRSLAEHDLHMRRPISLSVDVNKAGHNEGSNTSALGLSTATTPGILSGTSSLGYFHLPLSAGLSGSSTPLAALAGARYQNSLPHAHAMSPTWERPRTGSYGSVGTPPPRRETSQTQFDGETGWTAPSPSNHSHNESKRQKAGPNDLQVVAQVRYSGDIRLSLTADLLLDYPTPGFVNIPLKLNVTGLTFDGLALLAHTAGKAHFCFLAPEDAEAMIGQSNANTTDHESDVARTTGGLLEEIRVETEIGKGGNGRQILKNVDKVEKFVLEQVRQIFVNEFVFPSFWTFLV